MPCLQRLSRKKQLHGVNNLSRLKWEALNFSVLINGSSFSLAIINPIIMKIKNNNPIDAKSVCSRKPTDPTEFTNPKTVNITNPLIAIP
jgi:hypothetical protein